MSIADIPLSRRSLVLAAGAASAALAVPAIAETPAELTMTEALRARRSTRAFADRSVDPALLAELLWAAFGVNRPDTGLHTAPSWHGSADVVVHLATADGVLRYDPATNATQSLLTEDIRTRLSPEPFVATAPACLIFVSDQRKLTATDKDDEKRLWALVDAAMVSENVYVFAAARGLGTCLIGGLDRGAITQALALNPQEYPTFVQPVGYPA
jgi:nitroreductase